MNNPVLIDARNISFHYGEKILLDNANLSIHQGEKIGLIGKNGCGKSTFLRLINREIKPQEGELSYKNGLKIGYLPQIPNLEETKTVYENIYTGAGYVLDLLKKYESYSTDESEKIRVEEELNRLNGWNIETLIENVLESLNAPPKGRIVAELSGGEKRRVAICKTLISKPDILILDEPTNHLDTESIDWTEEFLASYSGACLFVTHDRYFLDRISTKIVEMDKGKFHSYKGNYSEYLEQKLNRVDLLKGKEDKRVKFLKEEVKWLKKSPKARTSKAKSRIENFKKTDNNVIYQEEKQVKIDLPQFKKLSQKVLEMYDISKEICGKKLLNSFNIKFTPGKKIGIIGRNGLGKTTLLKIILGEIKPDKGNIEIGENTEFNYIDQNRITIKEQETVLENVSDGKDYIYFGNEKMSVRAYLKKYLFSEEQLLTKASELSGGERARLTLAKILKNNGNFIIFDEPTNDLDLDTLRILEDTLSRFEGCILTVSHDRYFLNKICDAIIAFEGDSKVQISEGNYDYYMEKKKLRSVPKKKEVKKEKIIPKERKAEKSLRKLKYSEELELAGLEEEILKAEEKVKDLEEVFMSPDFYKENAEKTNEINEQLDLAKKEVERLYKRWEELEEIKQNYEDNI